MPKVILFHFLSFILFSGNVFSQNKVYACALSTEGILFCKYDIKREGAKAFSTNTVTDTITLTEANKIFAINAIADENNQLQKWYVCDFEMMIVNPGNDTVKLKNTGEKLTAEMTLQLKRINTGSRIYFQGIQATPSDKQISRRGLGMLSFLIR